MKKNLSNKTHDLVVIAILTAIIIFMTLTGLAYIPLTPLLKITLLTIPVTIGGVILGPKTGLFLGGIFGLTSLATCVFGMDAFGVILFGINPIYTTITCVVPRLMCGVIPAYIYKALKKKKIGLPITCVATPVLNTVMFMTALWLFFGNNIATDPQIIAMMGKSIKGFIAIFISLAGLNAVIEAIAGLIIGTAICQVTLKLWKKR